MTTYWNEERKLEYFLRLPWTLVTETTPEGDRLVRVRELPGAVASGETDEELEADLWDAIRAALRSYLHFGDRVPVPAGVVVPWDEEARSPRNERDDQSRTGVAGPFWTVQRLVEV